MLLSLLPLRRTCNRTELATEKAFTVQDSESLDTVQSRMVVDTAVELVVPDSTVLLGMEPFLTAATALSATTVIKFLMEALAIMEMDFTAVLMAIRAVTTTVKAVTETVLTMLAVSTRTLIRPRNMLTLTTRVTIKS